MPTSFSTFAPAKVNLFLHVGPAKANGRHDLDSLVVFAGPEASDRLTVEPSDILTLSVTGPGAEEAGTGGDNLVLKAARALQAEAGIKHGAALHLEKSLPVAAGIGGGSADAAAALRLLTRLWDINPRHARAVAPQLGGDVPVALFGQPAFMRGEGERVEPVRLPAPIPAVLFNPGMACPTGPVFAAFDAADGGAGFAECGPLPDFADLDGLIEWLAGQRNDLEAPALTLHAALKSPEWSLNGPKSPLMTRMSGSGATFVCLYATLDAARESAESLRAQEPEAWVRATLLGGADLS
ncbi:4-(cytidine 5'-diphospho)-2-C-methyl-D-erythritol kinase [Hyphomonas oceanitis]|uniref:4-(cytidine 5'-diphospho)-2-C-methyl-D-erythritol kinase n=1 Tax=Hyphomonas oceanitis TaxID=81033 RepID=UPI003001A1BE